MLDWESILPSGISKLFPGFDSQDSLKKLSIIISILGIIKLISRVSWHILSYAAALRSIKHRIQNLGTSVPFVVITDVVKGQKIVISLNNFAQHHFVLFQLFQRPSRKLSLTGTLWVAVVGPCLLSFICSRKITMDVSFNTAKDIGCPQGIPGNDTKHPPCRRWPALYLLCHGYICEAQAFPELMHPVPLSFDTSLSLFKNPCSLHSWSQTYWVSNSCH